MSAAPLAGPNAARIDAALAHKVLIKATRHAALAVLAALEKATESKPDDDDRAMLQVTGDALHEWVDDLEYRVGLDVDDLRAAVTDYCEARAHERLSAAGKVCVDDRTEGHVTVDGEEWDCFIDAAHAWDIATNTARAEAVLQPLCPAGWHVEPADPRGLNIGGAEIWEDGGERRFSLYVETREARWIAITESQDSERDGLRLDAGTDDLLRMAAIAYLRAQGLQA